MKDLITNVLNVALIGVIVLFGFKLVNTSSPGPQSLGFAGQEAVNRVTTRAGFAQGGVFTIATTASAYTLRDADLANNAVISITASTTAGSALALTTPASTTWPSLDANGTVQRWIIDDQHTAVATTTTITAGTGVDIDGTTANDDVINGGVAGTLACWRLPTSDIRCIVEEMVDAG